MKLLDALLKATYWFDDALQKSLVSNDMESLTRAQMFVVTNIALGEQRASRIARNLGVSRQAISRILIELNRRGIIVIHVDAESSRSQIIELHPEFKARGGKCLLIFEQIEQELSRRISAGRLAALRETLEMDWGTPPDVGYVTQPVKQPSVERRTSPRRREQSGYRTVKKRS